MNRGPAFLLKVGDGSDPSKVNTIAGLRVDKITLSEAKAFVKATGIFLGQAAERQAEAMALSGDMQRLELSFESGDKWRGLFLVQSLNFAGNFNGDNNYTISLEGSEVARV